MTTPSFDPQPCCGDAAGAACGQPLQFCQTSSSTGPVEHQGRAYDLTLPINPGFAVQSLQVGATSQSAGITWAVDDPDGSAFADDLKAFIESRMAGTTVTVTNPNAGTPQVCGAALPMQIHIECLRLDQDPPSLVELVYNGGQDLIQDPAYNENPPLNPPVSQGNYGFHLLARQDDPGPFPGNPPSGRVLCTTVANRGWETNDVGRTFEIWGHDQTTAQNVTPTPRGTPVQEITSDGPPPGGRSTIWQTFVAPSSGNFIIRVVHGARDPGEQHRITLDNGDTGDVQNGDLIDDLSTPASVTANGGPNPWTTFNQTIPLVGGSTYTLALSTTNPVGGARGGLFTDMRAYLDVPDVRSTATVDDDTCTVTADETTTTSVCSFWAPNCDGTVIGSWTNAETQIVLTNNEFWAQTPKPSCCTGQAATSTGGGARSNLVVSDVVCAIVGGVRGNVIREVLFDSDGGILETAFIGDNGNRVEPDSWIAGECPRQINDVVLCDRQDDGTTVSFLRKYVQTWDTSIGAQITTVRDFTITAPPTSYTVTGTVVNCAQTVNTAEAIPLCDSGNANHQFLRHYQHTGSEITGTEDTEMDGQTPYVAVGPVVVCSGTDEFTTTGLCLGDGTPIGVINRRTTGGAVVQDGYVNLLTGAFSAGPPPVGTSACGQTLNVQQSDVLCDITTGDGVVHGLVLIQYHYAPDGTVMSTDVINATNGTPYVPVGTITVCPTDTSTPDNDMQVLCDRQADGSLVALVRDYHRDGVGQINGFTDYTLGGAPYTVTGTVQSCVPRVSSSQILCDSAATPVRFLRTYVYGPTGAVASFTDTTLAGAPFVPTGAIGVCATTVQSDTDFVEEVLCDSNGTAFIRLFRFNSTTGTLISTTNTTLAGAAFAPVGAVGICGACCPVVVGEGCTNVGSGHYTALRLATGTISLIDSVTGAAVAQANIIACPGSTLSTLTAQHRMVADADAAWTPGTDVAGTLTSVTYTVISGTATVTDQNGTSASVPAGVTATWSVADGNTLTGPQSIDAVGGQTYVVWTQR